MDHGADVAASDVPRRPAPHSRFFEIGAVFQAVIHDHILPCHCLGRFLHEVADAYFFYLRRILGATSA